MNPDANLLILQYRTGNLPADKFADEMRAMNFSTRQIMQIMNAINQPNAPRQIPVPEPDGNVLPPEAYGRPAQQPQSDEERLRAMGITLPGASPSAAPQPQVNPTVALAREATARSEEGPSYGRPIYDQGQAQRFRPQYDEGQAQRFRPMPEQRPSPIRQAVAIAKDQAAQRQAVEQPQPDTAGAFTKFIRGDFREGADQRIMDAVRRQREESGVDSGAMARGGAAEKSKKKSKDDVLHKALEIIHELMMRR